MSTWNLAAPEALGWLWLVPAAAALYAWSARRRRRRLALFADSELGRRLVRGLSPRRRRIKVALVLAGLGATAFSLTQLQWGFEWQEVTQRGADLVVAVDLSESMLAEDSGALTPLSRLEQARREVLDLLSRSPGDRVALVAFAGTASLECPLTRDHGAAAVFLDAFQPDLLPLPGSDLGAGLRVALGALTGSPGRARAILLISDGEDHEGAAQTAAAEAARAGVPIYALGVGGSAGAPLPRSDGSLRRDERGELVLSRLDERSLAALTAASGGLYQRAVPGDEDLDALLAHGLGRDGDDAKQGEERRRHYHHRYQWVLALAVTALAIEPWIGERGREAE
ncbi:MAG TPA: VWA domain-containing protein [Thermoanaerobaculia bacterium]|nr:VWA domain-containing protein [Thermoanaerobaculia bacterium]